MNITVMTVVSVHVLHLTQVPHLHRPVFSHSVELIILLVKGDASDRVAMAKEAVHLGLVVDVPDAH